MNTYLAIRAEKEGLGKLEVFPIIKVCNWEDDDEAETIMDIVDDTRSQFSDAASKLYAACQQYVAKADDALLMNVIMPAMMLAQAVSGKTLVVNEDKDVDSWRRTIPAFTRLTVK